MFQLGALPLSQHTTIFVFQFAFGFEGLETISFEDLWTFLATFARCREIVGNIRK